MSIILYLFFKSFSCVCRVFGKDFFIRKGKKSKPRNIKLTGIFKLLQITKKIKVKYFLNGTTNPVPGIARNEET